MCNITILELNYNSEFISLALPPKGGMETTHLKGAKEIEPCKG